MKKATEQEVKQLEQFKALRGQVEKLLIEVGMKENAFWTKFMKDRNVPYGKDVQVDFKTGEAKILDEKPRLTIPGNEKKRRIP